MPRVNLNVPFSEKDQAKALGARWDQSNRTWFVPDGVDPKPFGQWLFTESSDDEFNLRSERYFILKNRRECWKCREITSVFSILLDEEHQELQYDDDDPSVSKWVSNDVLVIATSMEHMDPKTAKRMQQFAPQYTLDFSSTAGMKYYMNHCEQCTAKQGDFMLHSEPGGAFFPTSPEEASEIEFFQVEEPIKCRTSVSFCTSHDWILDYGREIK